MHLGDDVSYVNTVTKGTQEIILDFCEVTDIISVSMGKSILQT